MKVRTDLKAGDLMADITRMAQQAGNYLSQVITQADAQASQLTNDIYQTTTSLVSCMNESLQKNKSA